nr:MAG TPA: hypothetical protein [Caudoviricetes sp.]
MLSRAGGYSQRRRCHYRTRNFINRKYQSHYGKKFMGLYGCS